MAQQLNICCIIPVEDKSNDFNVVLNFQLVCQGFQLSSKIPQHVPNDVYMMTD